MAPRTGKPDTEVSVAEAVSFLTSRVAAQAREDSVPLTDIELRQLSFSERTASAAEIAAANEFDVSKDSQGFESKIAKLLRTAYRYDVKHHLSQDWERHLAALRDEDIYVLVMVDEAGIPRPKPKLLGHPGPKFSDTLVAVLSTLRRMLFRSAPDVVAGVVALCGLLYFFLLPMGWGRTGPRIFGNFAEHLIPRDSVRGVFFVIWIGSMLWLWYRTRDM